MSKNLIGEQQSHSEKMKEHLGNDFRKLQNESTTSMKASQCN